MDNDATAAVAQAFEAYLEARQNLLKTAKSGQDFCIRRDWLYDYESKLKELISQRMDEYRTFKPD
jgi:hypothetical protein